MKTIINVKTDDTLKKEAQEVAKDLGLPLGTIINNFLKSFVVEKRVVFGEQLEPNIQTQKILDEAISDIKKEKNLTRFDTLEEMDEFILKS